MKYDQKNIYTYEIQQKAYYTILSTMVIVQMVFLVSSKQHQKIVWIVY